MGIVAVYNKKKGNCFQSLYWGLVGINHTGQESCGFVTSKGSGLKRETYEGLVRVKKIDEIHLDGYCGIGNVNTILDRQPRIYSTEDLGIYGISFDGFIVNNHELRKAVGETFSTPYQVELVGKLIGKGKNLLDGVENLAKEIIGTYCLGIVTEGGEVFAARCPLAITPLIFGENEEICGISTESKGLTKMGMKIVRDLEPGEIVKIDDSGIHNLGYVEGKFGRGRKHCSFLWGYYSQPDSIIDGIPVNIVRELCGAKLAEYDNGLDFDIVSSVPRSADAYAEGYARASKHPLSFTLIKDDYALRSYSRPTDEERRIEASKKLSVIPNRVLGKRVVVVDDSLRRGTQAEGGPFEMLREAGAKEIHVRYGTPRNICMCRFAERDRPDENLPANLYKTDEEMARYLGVDSVRFIEVKDFVDIIILLVVLARMTFVGGVIQEILVFVDYNNFL